MFIDDLLQLSTTNDELRTGEIVVPDTWTQGRTVYGGLSAALICQAMTSAVSDDRQLRALSVGFAGPLLAGRAFHIEVEILREGRTISQVMGRAVQEGGVAVQIQAVFGIPLQSQLEITNCSIPNYSKAEQSPNYPGNDQPIPGFLQHLDMKLSEGDLPFSGSKELQMGGWMRFQQQPSIISVPHLVGLIDSWPPTTLPWLTDLAPASTVNWNLQFVHPLPELTGADYLGYQSTINASHDGFGYTSAKVWSPKGELIALSQQTVIIYG